MECVVIENPSKGGDINNCTITALHLAAGIPYLRAHEIGFLAGRKPNRGLYLKELFAVARKEGIRFRKQRIRRMTLEKFVAKNPTGRFVVEKRGHAFAVIEGRVFDTIKTGGKSIITKCYKVESHRIETIKKILKG